MTRYDYKVIPAPSKGRKAPGVKGAEARFAHSIQELMNEMAAEGWCYQRADILPSTERVGLTSSQTVYRSVLVFFRPHQPDDATTAPADNSEPEDRQEEGNPLAHNDEIEFGEDADTPGEHGPESHQTPPRGP